MRVGKGRTFGPMTSWLLPRTKSFGHPFDQSVRFGYFGEDFQTRLLKERASLIRWLFCQPTFVPQRLGDACWLRGS